MPQKIFIIRHGQTDHNKNSIAQGWLNVPLNQHGLKQAKLLAKSLKNTAIDHIYSSDLKRAAQTAKPLALIKSLKLITTPDLRERNLGFFEGKTWEELNTHHSDLVQKFDTHKHDLDWNEIDGESFRDISARIKRFISHLKTNHLDQTVAIITHGGTKRNLLHQFGFPIEAQQINIKNTSVTTLIKSGSKYTLESLVSTHHLPQ